MFGEIAGRKTQTVVFEQLVRGHESIRISKRKMDNRCNPRNEDMIKDKYIPAIFFDIKRAFDHVWWQHIVPLARERLSEEPIPSYCRLFAKTYGKPCRQTRSHYKERHKGMLARIHTPGPKSLKPSFRRSASHSRTEGRACGRIYGRPLDNNFRK